MNAPIVIGVAGKKRSGKDTFYNIVKNLIGEKYLVKRYAFADAVKEYVIKYFNVNPNEIKLEENRFLLQGLGQMFREEISKNYWIDIVFDSIEESRKQNSNEISVITDVRYLNEVNLIQEFPNSFLIKIENDRTKNVVDFHQSENDLNDFQNYDAIIKNNGELHEYEKEVWEWLQKKSL